MADPIINPWDKVWNPVRVCDVMVALSESRLMQPLKWRKPAKIFVNSALDPFHEDIADEWLDRIFAVIALCPQHTFQLLTKRPKRMRKYLSVEHTRFRIADMQRTIQDSRGVTIYANWSTDGDFDDPNEEFRPDWPLPNVWLGVTAEDQEAADARIPDLLATPAAVRFVSIEPMLGPIELCGYIRKSADWKWFPVECRHGYDMCPLCDGDPKDNGLDQVISGGESGPHARPSHPDWFRSLRDQCATAGVAYFHKKNGEWLHESQDEGQISGGIYKFHVWPDGTNSYRVGKRAAGRLLDGVEHSAFPDTQLKEE